jgi:hypothetical protein
MTINNKYVCREKNLQLSVPQSGKGWESLLWLLAQTLFQHGK